MTTFDPQATYSNWMSQLMKQDKWQDWMKPAEAINHIPMLESLKEVGAKIDPATMSKLQSDYMQEFSKLWQDFAVSKVPDFNDKRFSSPDWHNHAMHAYSAASYLLNARFLMAMAESVQAPEKTKQKIRFAVQQMTDAMSPANFLVTNPEAQTKIIESKGESLAKGITHMLADMQKGRISQTDESAFEVGKNVATSEGTVVFENRLFQLIQYSPLTKTVHQRPLLMVPPCINKFYILDLQPENSVVRYAVEQGHTVFLVSWANPHESLATVSWNDYIEEGAIQAIHTVQEISKQDKINAFGFCVGGTIISTALAALADRGEHPVSSLTLLTTLLDFSDTGILDVFVDEMQVSMREQTIGQGGLMPGRDLASTFSSLRANDLVWNYVQTNYLKGDSPPPFDLLYWNADSTNLPGPMFCWYLRNTYLENKLKKPNALTVAGNKIDLGKIDAPVFIYGSREDHIVPWQAAYASCVLLNPKKKSRNQFILGASGHIAGVVNPPAKKKRSYWTNSSLGSDAQTWFDGATEHPGSWWPEWAIFLSEHGGKMVKAPVKPGNASFKPIEPAPGRYVKVRAD
ncbi:class I poly(R)-hydroxyalkanoic acid synthase [Undibacterium sp. RTI2.1]|uniref:class I poly(R)-hydroxyalkanoic acid synthase n=1 Tax=unclassified Undibacterium TaxID=2630295 RepID=UPI002AB503B5|nr:MULTISPECIES: class I poly(R)-hydroxyalkanoic acid synthase [unclassified Undibacterium]MDY7537963.1 class I poly(R)-hydroxyalkanoic acid synthase [Undibacterium sp. 5I1]MEB0031821.1 class I poly(R)-hydroxyalkanoic acid synthase [Undibacterium sp. RTI2.1]MEB0117254.1 class I poly(R)-hydroxyalkanoic acid synthase [Undibacterium sp. RTI2.2]MEB0231053.1 class I poly(R)-hydroxyalkanoic acid synthase [Undibacterium sp. 10I3]MEB0257548.1 class I poly(R)-hydroxyalkanoic acid synthase [Undibacteriu